MSDENKQERSRWERWQDPYRMVIRNEDSLQEVASYKLTLLNVYIALSALVVLVATAVALFIAYTPAKRLIPGYSGADHAELILLYKDLDSLDQLVRAQQRYNEGIRRMLVGDVEYAPDPPTESKSAETPPPPVARVEEDEQLRQEVEMEDIRSVTGNPKTAAVNVSPRETPLEQMNFTSPVSGSVSLKFDAGSDHFGVDVIAPKNTPIKAALDGWVIASDWTLETGNTIAIQHANNTVTFYKHNSALLKKVGDYVRAGEAIAIIGNTGELTDGPHLHFELWHKGKAVDPEGFVNFR
ncbi:MAG TPA: M23 family metallopeptidase [Bacteroidetes bacterium]|nr:M23 family metallopeptidase [Bacteroidota bacterium]